MILPFSIDATALLRVCVWVQNGTLFLELFLFNNSYCLKYNFLSRYWPKLFSVGDPYPTDLAMSSSFLRNGGMITFSLVVSCL